MVVQVFSFLIVLVLAVLFIWLVIRAWRVRHAIPRWISVILAGLFSLLFTTVFVIAVVGLVKANFPPYKYGEAVAVVPVTGGQDAVKRGAQIAVLCTGCHSSTGKLPLDGSGENMLAGGPPLGSIYAPDLTPSGPLVDWTDAQIARAIREGVDKNGRPLIVMPSQGFHYLSDEDVMSIVAFLRSQPPSNRPVPTTNLNVLGYALLGSGLFSTSAQPPITSPVVAPPKGPTADYGHYLITAVGCQDCHGANLVGGAAGGFGPPPGPNLTAIVPHWSQSDFITFFRTGVAPGGVKINPDNMPWAEYSPVFSDEDLQAIYSYIHALPLTNGPSK